jgi:amidohydrolase
MELENAKKKVCELVDGFRKDLVELSNNIHENPETKMVEHRACEWLTAWLKEKGFEIETGIAGLDTAFRARFSTGQGPRIAFMAEYDALPEIGHACGHNLICTGVLGAAAALSHVKDVPMTIEVLGTPGEEGGGGKVIMAEAGSFDDLDVALMWHPSNKNEVGEQMIGVKEFIVEFKGKAVHAAAEPEKGINALDAVIHVFNSINALRQHVTDDVRMHGVITHGGTKPNIIPEHASCEWFIRAQDEKYLEEIEEKFRAIVKGAEHSTGAIATVKTGSKYRPRKMNLPLIKSLQENLKTLGIDAPGPISKKGNISSDFGDVSQIVPSAHPFLKIVDGTTYHTREFATASASDLAHGIMIVAAKALAMTALDVVLKPGLLEKIKEAHESS